MASRIADSNGPNKSRMSVTDDVTDLGALWNQGLDEYTVKTGVNLKLPHYNNMSDAMTVATKQMDEFSRFRHNEGKVDKVRSAFGRHLSDIQKATVVVQTVASAASIVPPAMPAAALVSAFTFLLQTFQVMKADYDMILQFFDEMHSFMERISILEGRLPKLDQVSRCVMRVFTSMLNICAISGDYKKEGRFKKWVSGVFEGKDPNLAGCYHQMEEAISRLHSAAQFATLGNTEDIKHITRKIELTTNRVENDMEQVRHTSDRTETIVTRVENNTDEIKMTIRRTQTVLEDTKQDISQDISKLEQALAQRDRDSETRDKILLNRLNRLGHVSGLQESTLQAQQTHKTKDTAGKKHEAFNRVKNKFHGVADEKAQRQEIINSMVEGTSKWIFEEEKYTQWQSGERPLLWISGNAGLGKSYLVHSVLDQLEKNTSGQSRTSVVYFFFKEEHEEYRSIKRAVDQMIIQIAESDSVYCEQVAVEIAHNENTEDLVDVWSRFILSKFPGGSDESLYILLDGIDETTKDNRLVLLRLLSELSLKSSNVHAVVACRPMTGLRDYMDCSNSIVVEITKENMAGDIQKLIEQRCKSGSLSRIRKFRPHTRRKIMQKLKKRADSMLYVEHMLRRLNAIGREKAVLQELEGDLPQDLISLYALLLSECQKDRSAEHYQSLKKLFAWLAFSKRLLSLQEAEELLKVASHGKTLDLEDEIIGRSARILDISGGAVDDDSTDQGKEGIDVDAEGESLEHLDDEDSTPLKFQDRSMREYFRAMDVDDDGLRTTPSQAHLTIFKMAVSVICEPYEYNGDVAAQKPSPLKQYAANFWSQHFLDIDIEKAADEQAKLVVQSLAKIFQNQGQVTKTLAEFADEADVYSTMFTSHNETPWLETMKMWADRAKSLDQEVLGTETTRWIAEIETVPKLPMVMLPLARGHVQDWLRKDEDDPEYRRRSSHFRFAFDALKMSGILDDLTLPREWPPSAEIVLRICEIFPEIQKDAEATRNITSLLLLYGYYDQALVQCQQSLEMQDTNFGRCRSLLLIAYAQLALDRTKEAEEVINQTLVQLGEEFSDTSIEKIQLRIRQALLLGAQCQQKLEKVDEAINNFEKARLACPTIRMDGYDLIAFTEVLEKKENPTVIIEAFKNWTEEERNSWFGAAWYSDEAMAPIQRAAKKSGGDDLKFLVQAQEAWNKSVSNPRGPSPYLANSINRLTRLSHTYRRVVGDSEKAKAILQDIMTNKATYFEQDSYAEIQLYNVRLELVDIIYEEFRSITDTARKAALLDEMRIISASKLAGGDVGDQEESLIAIPYALMTRMMGPALDFQATMEKTFKSCIDGLTDTIGYNDEGSFRLLAKVLAIVGGMDRDAQIALSMQFSVTDPKVSHSYDDSDSDSDEEAKGESGGDQVIEKTRDTKETTGQNEGANVESLSRIINETVHEVQETFEASRVVAQFEVTFTHADNTGEVDAATATEASQRQLNLVAEEETVQEVERDSEESTEDLNPQAGVGCDGCGRGFNSWTDGPIYCCLTCNNCDLCPDCYQKRTASTENEIPGEWKTYCGVNHRYIKGPIRGWKGVKGGVIKIEEDEIEFKAWLKDLQDTKWKEAWGKFWRIEALRDIMD